MRLILACLAAALVAQHGASAADAPQIVYDVKILDMHGLGWRSTFYPDLQTVVSRGGVTAWTMPSSTTGKIAAKAEKIISAPKVTALSEARAFVSTFKTVNMVNAVDRQADGPINHASLVAFRPHVEGQNEGDSIQISGRKLDQGVLTQVEIEDRQITSVHQVKLSEEYENDKRIVNGDKVTLSMVLQVPEIVHSRVSGEWLVPNNGALLVSLGVHTSADAKGRAVVRERLAIIEARAIETASVQKASIAPIRPTLESVDKVTTNANLEPYFGALFAAEGGVIPMPVPIAPSRALPQGHTAAGVPIALPPLPEDVEPPTMRPDTSEACATPQLRGEPIGDPIPPRTVDSTHAVDPNFRQARVEPSYADPVCLADSAKSTAPPAPRFPSKEVNFRIPISNDLTIEVRASARPVPYANVPPPPVQPAQ
jgi:hypothetical protein